MGRARAATRRRLTLGAAVLSAAALLAVAIPQEAQAATGCPGRKVRTLHFSTGSVLVYERGGYVCAVTVPKKAGTKRRMSVGTCPRVVDTSEPGPGRGRVGGISYGDEGLLAR
ncbi:hypothetical protein, partial [Streptomyces sp. NPDC048392]|uniref:hypothetical protein n=1 Tax=Streptomyces sp. NPDC048392 TaxID=3365543 RepID=UPI00371FC599